MGSVIRSEGDYMISTFIIDRAASGIGYDLMRSEFEEFFKMSLTKQMYDDYLQKYAIDIDKRRDEIRELIYKSGTYNKLIRISNILFELIQNGGEPKEISSLAATLRGYLEAMSKLGISQNNKVIKQQNNFLIFKDLEADGVITIKDQNRLKYLVDDVDVSEPESE